MGLLQRFQGMLRSPTTDSPADPGKASDTTTCVCGGPLKRVRANAADGAWVVHYRCQGDCRRGGHTLHDQPGAPTKRRVGPVFGRTRA